MANSNVAVDAHSGEGKDTGEHVVVINGHHDLAQNVSKRPCTNQVIHTLEGLECLLPRHLLKQG